MKMKLTCFLFMLFSLIPNYLAGGEPQRGTVIYKQSVNGYKVSVELLTREGGDLPFAGEALLYFSSPDGKRFSVYNPCYGDENLDLKALESGATKYIDYIPTDHPYLAGRSPFYFADMDYDGQEELVVVNWRSGRQFAHQYEVYEVEDHYADKKNEPPFDSIEQGRTDFRPAKKQIVNTFATLFEEEEFIYEKVESTVNSSFTVPRESFVLKSFDKKDVASKYPEVHIEYKQRIKGYKVNVKFHSYAPAGELSEIGQTTLHFSHKDGHDFYVSCPYYSDPYLYLNEYIVRDNDNIKLDYVPKDDEYLATKSPFYFSDMDFDGREELVVVNWASGGKGGHSYDVYDIDEDYSLHKKENPPFDEIEQHFTSFDKSSQTITNSVVDGVWYSAEYHYKKSRNGTFSLLKSVVKDYLL